MPYYPPSGGGGGGGGGGTGTAVSGEVPSGPIDGVNYVFTIAHVALPNTFRLYKNGLRQKLSLDFIFSSVTITFADPPLSGELIQADYSY